MIDMYDSILTLLPQVDPRPLAMSLLKTTPPPSSNGHSKPPTYAPPLPPYFPSSPSY